jgi:hypothetical protein
MTTIVAFLTARIGEREALARKIQEQLDAGWNYWDELGGYIGEVVDPPGMLREVAADRAILALIFQYEAKIDGEWGCCHSAAAIRLGECPETPPEEIETLRVLAAVDSDHPDYNQAWKP